MQQEQQDNINEIVINKGMKSKEIIDNDKLNVKVNNILQVKQISNEFIKYNNYYTSTTKLSHEQREQSQSIEIPETEIESTDK